MKYSSDYKTYNSQQYFLAKLPTSFLEEKFFFWTEISQRQSKDRYFNWETREELLSHWLTEALHGIEAEFAVQCYRAEH